MNQIERLKNDLERMFLGISTELDPPCDEERGTWHLDIRRKGASPLVVEWRPDHGYGVSSIEGDASYGVRPDEVFTNSKAALARIKELVITGEHTKPPTAVRLAELRQFRGMTQAELAESLGVGQANIARIEGRLGDIKLATLAKVVAGMGGKVHVTVSFPDGSVKELQLSDSVTPDHVAS